MSSGRDFETQINTAFIAPNVTIDNYKTVIFVLPTESVVKAKIYYEMVVVGLWTYRTGSFSVRRRSTTTPCHDSSNASVNFFDNNADNGGSPPGGEDNLVLGHTNFTAELTHGTSAFRP